MNKNYIERHFIKQFTKTVKIIKNRGRSLWKYPRSKKQTGQLNVMPGPRLGSVLGQGGAGKGEKGGL